MTARKTGLLFMFLVVVGGIAVVWYYNTQSSSREVRNVLLVSIDTCRADYLSCYGYPHNTTPNIDALAEEGVLFEHVVTPVPLTLPAHGSMLTGTIPPYHRVHDNLDYRLADENITLAELMKAAGYKTAAFVSTFVLDERFGIGQGFDYYDDDCCEQLDGNISAERAAEETTTLACEWLGANEDEKFFLFVHYYDPHTPFVAPQPFASAYGQDPKGAYAAEIAYTDHCIGMVLDKLKQSGLYDSTLIIITADHGEALGEHGEQEHGYFIYDCSVRVPLVIKGPGSDKGVRVKEAAGIVDIVPTICSMVGISQPDGVSGRDLSVYVKGGEVEKNERYLYCESLLSCELQCNPLLGVSTADWKYIQTTRPEVYDLRKDTGEQNNLAEAEDKRGRMMGEELKIILEENVRAGGDDGKMTLDDESRKRLASLGYVGGGSVSDTLEFDKTKSDAKDFIGFHLRKAEIEKNVMLKSALEQAQKDAAKLIEEYPQVACGYYLRGQVALRQEQWETALKYYRRAGELDPGDFRACLGAGRALMGIGNADDAVVFLQKALELNPDYMETYLSLGTAYDRLGKFKEAVHCLTMMVGFQPDSEDAHFNLGIALWHFGERRRAVEHFQRAAKLAPERVDIRLSLADNLNKLGKAEEAIVHYKKAIELDRSRAYTHSQLAEVYLKTGRLVQAVMQWKEALRLKPDQPYVLNNLAWLCVAMPDAEFYDPAQALIMAKKACELGGDKEVSYMDTLSVAYAAAGQFERACATAQKAIDLASAAGQEKLAQQIQNRLQLYKAGRAYWE